MLPTIAYSTFGLPVRFARRGVRFYLRANIMDIFAYRVFYIVYNDLLDRIALRGNPLFITPMPQGTNRLSTREPRHERIELTVTGADGRVVVFLMCCLFVC